MTDDAFHASLMRTIGNLEGSVSAMREEIKELLLQLKTHEVRIQTLQTDSDTRMGKLSVVLIAASALFALIGAWVQKNLV